MTNKISQKEWEVLSAYLDNQLSPKERARIEAALRDNQQLREGFEYLNLTRSLVRALPRYRPNRNFTVTPEMVGMQRSSPASPGLRLVAVAATMMLLIVIMSDLILSRISSPIMPAQVSAPQEIMSEALPREEESTGSLSPAIEVLEEPTAAPPEVRGMEAPTAAPQEKESTLLESLEVESAQEEEPAVQKDSGAGDQEAVLESAPFTLPEPTASPAVIPTQAPGGVFGESSLLISTPTPDTGEANIVTGFIQSITSQPPLRYAEVIIGLMAILLWVAALILRRR